MSINPEVFIKPSDRAAMRLLGKIPGYNTALKLFMKLWGDGNLRLAMLSSKLRVNERQLPEYHKMLTDLCNKLGIEEIPEMYIENYPYPNAYTIGEKKPMIVLTSALLESIPTELVPTVLARECGHIICGHVQYTTVTYLAIWRGLISDINSTVSPLLESGFYNWLRASEYSADRVAAVCDGTSDKLTELYMYYAGYSSKLPFKPDKEEFLRQGEEYTLADKEIKNKAFEDLNRKRKDHPFCAEKAYVCNKWAASEDFDRVCKYVEEESNGITEHDVILLPFSSKDIQDKPFDTVREELEAAGFNGISRTEVISSDASNNDPKTAGVKIDGRWEFDQGEPVDKTAECVIACFVSKGNAQQADSFIAVSHSSSYFNSKNVDEVLSEFRQLGFSSVTSAPKAEKKKKSKQKTEPDTVLSVMINGVTKFKKNTRFEKSADVIVFFSEANEK